MRLVRKAIVASAAVIPLAAVAGTAAAEIKNAHVTEVRLPDGSGARIRYAGDTSPMMSSAPAPIALPCLAPTLDPWSQEAPLAALAQLSAAINRQPMRFCARPVRTEASQFNVASRKPPPNVETRET